MTMPGNQTPAAQPFFIPGQPGKPGVLLVHGFSSGPSDVRELGEYLASQGLTVSGLLLPGHGTTPDDLNRQSSATWSRSVIENFQTLRQSLTGEIYVIGYSFGGNLLITAMADQAIDPSGLVTINTPLFLPKEFIHRFLIPVILPLKKSVKKSWVKPEQRAQYERLGKYTVLPLRALHEMYLHIARSRKVLQAIGRPAMVIQTRKDFNVQPRSAQYLFDHVISGRKKLRYIDSPEHHYYETPGRFEVYRAIGEFIIKHKTNHESSHTIS